MIGPRRRARAILAAVALAAAVLVTGCGRLDRDAVQSEVETIQSAAAEGMLVAREDARGRSYENFVEIRCAELHSQVQKAEEKLDSTPAEKGYGQAASDAVSLAAQIRTELETLHDHPNDRAVAGQVADALGTLSDKVDKISSNL